VGQQAAVPSSYQEFYLQGIRPQVCDVLGVPFTACDFSSFVLIIRLSVGNLRVVNPRSKLLLPRLPNLHHTLLLRGQLFQQRQLLLMPYSIVVRQL
jgi:hypothetical protein